MLKLIECPRDAMQGIDSFIPTELKVKYMNQLLKVGFDTLDFGSFVSPKAIPQMSDTEKVLSQLEKGSTNLLAIVANRRGAEKACTFADIDYIGYPFSISETFQIRNTKKTIEESKVLLEEIQKLCVQHGKKLVVYLSMGFGNPYGEEYSTELVVSYAKYLLQLGVHTISLSDTIGSSEPSQIKSLYTELISLSDDVEFGAHLHASPQDVREKVIALTEAGCTRIDVALGGLGGCPMAQDDLVGNLATERVLATFAELEIETHLDMLAFAEAQEIYKEVFMAGAIQ